MPYLQLSSPEISRNKVARGNIGGVAAASNSEFENIFVSTCFHKSPILPQGTGSVFKRVNIHCKTDVLRYAMSIHQRKLINKIIMMDYTLILFIILQNCQHVNQKKVSYLNSLFADAPV